MCLIFVICEEGGIELLDGFCVMVKLILVGCNEVKFVEFVVKYGIEDWIIDFDVVFVDL